MPAHIGDVPKHGIDEPEKGIFVESIDFDGQQEIYEQKNNKGKKCGVLIIDEELSFSMEAFTGGASSAAGAARTVVDFADTPPFGLEETQRAAQLLLGCGVRASELKSTLESLGNGAAGGGMSLEQMAIRLSVAFQSPMKFRGKKVMWWR